MFQYPPFNSSQQLKHAAQNNPSLKRGAKGYGVQLIELAYSDLGYKLPRSIKSGVPDGIFGGEVKSVTEKFQVDYRTILGPGNPLKKDGILGRNSIRALDLVIAKHSHTNAPKQKPKISPKPALPTTQEYKVGNDDPQYVPDPGAGRWNSKPMEISYFLLKSQILSYLPHAAVIIGPDAALHMYHYLEGNGKDYTIDLEGMVSSVKSATKLLKDEIGQAQQFVEKLPLGEYFITSRILNEGYNEKDESKNWFFAIGGYAVWGKGVATVIEKDGKRRYQLDFEYKFRDRYNWDAGKQVELLGITITDEFMGEFHRQGLAREYNCYGKLKRKLSWNHGEAIPSQQIGSSGGR